MPLMFEDFAKRSRVVIASRACDLDVMATREGLSMRDNAAAQASELIALAAMKAASAHIARATFLQGCAEAYDDADK